MKKKRYPRQLFKKWTSWTVEIQSFPLGFPVNNVEEKCILNTTKGSMARNTELKIISKHKRTGRFLPGFSYKISIRFCPIFKRISQCLGRKSKRRCETPAGSACQRDPADFCLSEEARGAPAASEQPKR